MIKVTGTQRMVRQTTSPFEYQNENGELTTGEITVRYYVQTAKEARDRHEAARTAYKQAKESGELIPFEYYTDTLSQRLESLPDLETEGGKKFAITPENLGMLTVPNINAIHKAIEDDQSPKEQPSKSQNGLNSANAA